jgi:hypothetical protein
VSDGNAYRSAYGDVLGRYAKEPIEPAAARESSTVSGFEGTKFRPNVSKPAWSALREGIVRELREIKANASFSNQQMNVGYCLGLDAAIDVIITKLRDV